MPKLRRLLGFFTGAKKVWFPPRKSRVLIFDAALHELLADCLAPWNPELLHVGGETINVPALLASLLRGGKRLDAYVDAFIGMAKPRLIITMIDNRLDFYTVGARHPMVKTMFVQNGWRGYYADVFETLDKPHEHGRGELRVQYMMTFGPVAGAEYVRFISGSAIPMGSLKNNLAVSARKPQRDVLAFVSQWRSDGLDIAGTFRTQEEFIARADRLVLETLAPYAKRNGKRLVIIPVYRGQAEKRRQEEAYFNGLLGGRAEFFDGRGPFPSYDAIDGAQVTVTIDTTLGYEAIARGRRTAIFSIRGGLLGVPGLTFGWPGEFADDGPYWTNRADPEAFVRILDHLFEVDQQRWSHELEETRFDSLMLHDPGNTILKSVLAAALGPPADPLYRKDNHHVGNLRRSQSHV